jgi:amidase
MVPDTDHVLDPADLDAVGQAELVRRNEVSPLELVDSAVARIEKHNPSLNAVIHPLFEKARRQASECRSDAPFRGVPMLLKDLTAHSAGDPMHEGMQMLRDIGWVESEDTYLVMRLREAGFLFVGRTNAPELGLLPTTEPTSYGPARNPWDTARSTGGSSGGSAAAVAARMTSMAHANDGGGSIRIPSSECGVVGLKPTRGRTSLGPDYGEIWAALVAEHVVCRSVRDTASVLDVLQGPMPGDPYYAPPPPSPYAEEVGADPGRLRVGVLVTDPNGIAPVHPDCAEAARSAARLLEEMGHDVQERHPEALADAECVTNFLVVYATFTAWCLDEWFRKTQRRVEQSDCEPTTWALAEMGRAVSGPDHVMAVQYLQRFSRRVRAWWEVDGFDVLVTPTIPEPPPALGQFESRSEDPLAPVFRAASVVSFTAPFNITGQPAISAHRGAPRRAFRPGGPADPPRLPARDRPPLVFAAPSGLRLSAPPPSSSASRPPCSQRILPGGTSTLTSRVLIILLVTTWDISRAGHEHSSEFGR